MYPPLSLAPLQPWKDLLIWTCICFECWYYRLAKTVCCLLSWVHWVYIVYPRHLRETLIVCICEVLLLLILLLSWLIILPCLELLGWFLWVSAFSDSVLDTVYFLSLFGFLEDCNSVCFFPCQSLFSVCWVCVNSLMSFELFPDLHLDFAQECKRLSVVYFDESIFYTIN